MHQKKFKKQIFFVLNPDTIWRKGYKKEFRKLEKVYLKNKKPTMLLVSKNKSYDRSFKGDFNLNSKNQILRQKITNLFLPELKLLIDQFSKKEKSNLFP